MIPVTAGKNTANTTQKLAEGRAAAAVGPGATGCPNRNDSNDSAMAPMITYWARMAARTDSSATAVTSTVVTRPTAVWFRLGKTRARLSAKPMV